MALAQERAGGARASAILTRRQFNTVNFKSAK